MARSDSSACPSSRTPRAPSTIRQCSVEPSIGAEVCRGTDREHGRLRDPTIDVASGCGPVLVVQSFGPRTAGVPMEGGLRGIARQWQPEPLHHRLQCRSLEAEPDRGSPGSSDHPVRLFENPRDVRPLDAFERLALVVGGSRRGLDPKRGECQEAAWRQNYGAMDHILQLADVSRPRMVTERLPRLARDHIDAAIQAAGKLADEVIDERVDVLRPLTEGRYRDREDVQAVVQIVTEAAPFDHPGEVAVRGGDQTDVDVDRPCPAETLELVFLQHAQELRLQLERDLAHLVQEERATVSQLEPSDPLRDRAGERPPLVPEQLALEQARRDGGTVHLDEGPVAAPARIADGAGNQFLSRAGLAQEENSRVGRRDDLDLVEDVSERHTIADDVPLIR